MTLKQCFIHRSCFRGKTIHYYIQIITVSVVKSFSKVLSSSNVSTKWRQESPAALYLRLFPLTSTTLKSYIKKSKFSDQIKGLIKSIKVSPCWAHPIQFITEIVSNCDICLHSDKSWDELSQSHRDKLVTHPGIRTHYIIISFHYITYD